MAFTQTSLSTTPLLETTFISDMRLIVNANITLLKTQLEDIVNGFEFDITNKYIGVDNPVNTVFTQNNIVTNQILFKNGTSAGATTIASLTQSSGTSTFLTDNLTFTKNLTSLALGSKVSTPTVVIGSTTGNLPISYMTTSGTSGTSGTPAKGLYVGDATNPMPSKFYGEVEFVKQAVAYSSTYTTTGAYTRTLNLTGDAVGNYVNLVLSRTDPQMIYLNLELGAATANSQYWLLLHDDYTTATSRPLVGQTFTIVLNEVQNSGTAVAPASLPTVSNTGSNNGIQIISGWSSAGAPGAGLLIRGLVNSGTSGSTASATAAISAVGTNTRARFYNQYGQSGSTMKPLNTSITLTKIDEGTNYSRYAVTGSSNAAIIN